MKKISAVICELNPLHTGHAFLFQKAKEDAQCLIAVMSGNFVQRGECAIFHKYDRAVSAVEAGADLVLELPYPWCSGSAEFFAAAGVHIVQSIGATHLYFGSETGDLHALQLAASVINSDAFQKQFPGVGQAGVRREELLSQLCPSLIPGFLSGANDILGTEYCRRLNKTIPVPVKRLDCTGASALRASITQEILESGKNPEGIVLSQRLADILFYFLRCADVPPEGFAEGGGGVIQRLMWAAREAVDGMDLFARASTKQYTNARFRRGALFAMTKTTLDMLRVMPNFTRVLAANAIGRAFLSEIRREKVPVQIITNHRERSVLSIVGASQYAHAGKADALYTLCMEPPRPAGWFSAMCPVML
ncbi:MAG: nucleotidyltransferase family protein [Clostridiales bacterium]|jgi:predicted nucleotidyltransferase|nr:nucleotidyltransferase family protein [Clostridiales bacterium]